MKTRWFLFLGEAEGIAEDNRRTERAAVKVPALGLRVSLPWHCLGEPPVTDQSGRYPKAWLQEFLYSAPRELEERGVSVQVSQVSPHSWEWLKEWEGREVNAKEAPSANLKPEQLRQLVKEPRLVLLPHDEGLVLTKATGGGGDEFGTPPRPPSIAVTVAPRCSIQEGGPPQEVDSGSLHESFRDAHAQGASIGEAIALVASAYNIGPEIVQMSVLGALRTLVKKTRKRLSPLAIPLHGRKVDRLWLEFRRHRHHYHQVSPRRVAWFRQGWLRPKITC